MIRAVPPLWAEQRLVWLAHRWVDFFGPEARPLHREGIAELCAADATWEALYAAVRPVAARDLALAVIRMIATRELLDQEGAE